VNIGCSTISLGHVPVGIALDEIAAAGFSVIDVAAIPKTFPHIDLSVDASSRQGDGLAAQIDSLSLRVSAVNSIPWIPDALDEPRELLRRYRICADVAAAIQAELWIVDANTPASSQNGGRKRGVERWLASVAIAAELAADRNLRLAVEAPHALTLAVRIDDVLELLDVVDSPDLCLDFDTSHAYLSGQPMDEWIRAVGHRIAHVSVRDLAAEVGAVNPGEGLIDFGLVLGTLQDVGYAGDIVLELEPSGERSLAQRKADAIQSRQYLQSLLGAATG
jgi:sugar phosphate isomerase/epimerase